ncbi:ClpP/crotonase [Polyporus arcularius HHB13444]|uniref:ClpP/crotonase n=1 Tax=Polyporus arcularius HHB13444 TaxID=1314778 RepID=A0A5C3PNI6_9APHY|nr:ClpP/crotonase [Polyporus arcularius HHB13444]
MSSSDSYSRLSGQFTKVSSPSPHVALVQLARNPVNAFHEPFWTELGNVFDAISNEPSIRAVVLASALPKLFCAGIDLAALKFTEEVDAARKALELQKTITSFQHSISALERCRYPVIVATHGVAYGLSIDIIAACDVRYTASNAIFSIKEVDVGLAADIGTLARTPKITGNQSLVSELAFTGRNFSAAEAEKMGLVSRVVEGGRDEVVAAALETAKLIAEKSPIAVLGTKHLLQHARDHSVQENLQYTVVWNSAMLQTQDMAETMQAMQRKTKPKFANLGPKL